MKDPVTIPAKVIGNGTNRQLKSITAIPVERKSKKGDLVFLKYSEQIKKTRFIMININEISDKDAHELAAIAIGKDVRFVDGVPGYIDFNTGEEKTWVPLQKGEDAFDLETGLNIVVTYSKNTQTMVAYKIDMPEAYACIENVPNKWHAKRQARMKSILLCAACVGIIKKKTEQHEKIPNVATDMFRKIAQLTQENSALRDTVDKLWEEAAAYRNLVQNHPEVLQKIIPHHNTDCSANAFP